MIDLLLLIITKYAPELSSIIILNISNLFNANLTK